MNLLHKTEELLRFENELFLQLHLKVALIYSRVNYGPVHTYADIFENGGLFLRFGVASTRKRRFRHAKTEVFENALQSGGFRKRRFRVYV